MVLKINGQPQNMVNVATLQELVYAKGLKADSIVIEHNYAIIPRKEWGEIKLKDNDVIEVVSFVGGG